MRLHSAAVVFAFGLSAVLAGCSNANSLPDATIPNVVTDSVRLGALTGTPVALPSGFSVADGVPVRTDQSSSFDFAFDIKSTAAGKRGVFIPLAALGLTTISGLEPGVQRTTQAFDAITVAPSNGYTATDTVGVDIGAVYYVRSRVVCGTLGVPEYGKLEVTAVDTAARTVFFRVLVDQNCGYRGLKTGLPQN